LLKVDNNCVDTNELNTKNRGMATAVTGKLSVVAKHGYICNENPPCLQQDSRLVSNALYDVVKWVILLC
jgi:hypothetical protein